MITLWRCFYYAEKQHKIYLECKKSCFYGASGSHVASTYKGSGTGSGPISYYCGNRMYRACRTVDGTGCRRSLRTVRRYCRMLSERLCGESVYYTGIHSLGRSSGPFQKILFKQIQKGKDRGDFGFYCHYRSHQLSVSDNGRTGDYAWI